MFNLYSTQMDQNIFLPRFLKYFQLTLTDIILSPAEVEGGACVEQSQHWEEMSDLVFFQLPHNFIN